MAAESLAPAGTRGADVQAQPAGSVAPTRRARSGLGRGQSSPRRRLALLLSVLGTAGFVVRGSDRLRRATFWAEDGRVFFRQVHTLGWRSLFHPYAGYVHVIPRLVAIATQPIPLTETPRAYDAAAVVISLAMIALVLSRRLAWLLPSPAARAVTFLIICVVPGDWEAYGNIANLIFFAGIALALLALCDDPATMRGRGAELFALLLLGLSGPDVALIVPLFAYRLWRCRSRQSAACLGLAVTTAAVQYGIFLGSTRATADTGTVVTVVRELLERIVGALLVGDSNTATAWSADHLAVLAGIWLLVLVVAAGAALRWVAAVLGVMVVVTLVPAAYVYGSFGFPYPNLDRQYMLPRALLIIMAVATAARARSAVPRPLPAAGARALAVVCLASCTFGVIHDFWLPRFSPTADTAAFLHCLKTSHKVCKMDIAPAGWVVSLRPKDWP